MLRVIDLYYCSPRSVAYHDTFVAQYIQPLALALSSSSTRPVHVSHCPYSAKAQ